MENRDYIVAIDLGTNNVVTAVGYRDENGKMKVVDCEMAPVQGMVRGEIKNIELVSQAIKNTLDAVGERLGIRIAEAYAGISGQHIRCVRQPYHVFVGRDGEIRQEDVQQLHASMRNVQAPDGEKILQIIPQNYIVDGEEETTNPVGTFGKKLEATFNFVIGDANAINRLERALARVNVKSLGLFLNAVASAEAVATSDEKEEGVAVVDIGGGTTDVTIFHRGVIRHVGVIPIGGNAINRDIRSYGILEKHVESLKVKYGSAMRELVQSDKFISTPGLNARAPKEISFQNLAAIIEARMLDVIDFVMEEIKNSGYRDRLGAGVVLTGGTAQMKDLDALFKNYTGLDVRIALPELELDEESPSVLRSAAASTAVGILIKGAESGKPARLEKAAMAAPSVGATAGGASASAAGGHAGRGSGLFGGHRKAETVNDRYRDEQQGAPASGTEPETPAGPEPGGSSKPGFFERISSKLSNWFDDTIDDNEI